jgi:hypothetical protein
MMFDDLTDRPDEKRRSPRWTGEEVRQAFELRSALCTDEEIGQYLGRSTFAVRWKLNKEARRVAALDAVDRNICKPIRTVPKRQATGALHALADRYANGSTAELCRLVMRRLAKRPDVVDMLMEGGR